MLIPGYAYLRVNSVFIERKNIRAGKPSRADWLTMFIKRKNIRAGKPSWVTISTERKNTRAGKPSRADWFTMFYSKRQIAKSLITLEEKPQKYEEKIINLSHKIYICSDFGYDLNAYFSCFKKFRNNYKYFCFLNSFSEINGADWLRKLSDPLNNKTIGLVGATGSYGTMVPKYLAPSPNLAIWKRVLRPILLPLIIRFKEISFDSFPNPHIRTNGFVISAAIFNQIKFPMPLRKLEAYKFESGRSGLTKQIKKLGLKCVIVGNNGNVYSENYWPESRIFWSSDQENLLIKDNQTNYYQNANAITKKKLFISAWQSS